MIEACIDAAVKLAIFGTIVSPYAAGLGGNQCQLRTYRMRLLALKHRMEGMA